MEALLLAPTYYLVVPLVPAGLSLQYPDSLLKVVDCGSQQVRITLTQGIAARRAINPSLAPVRSIAVVPVVVIHGSSMHWGV